MPIMKSDKKVFKKKVAVDNDILSFLTVILAIILVIILITSSYIVIIKVKSPSFLADGGTDNQNGNNDYPFKQDISVKISLPTDETLTIDDINSGYAALVDLTDGTMVASKRSSTVMYPASMTKVMTLIVVCENLPNEAALDEVLEIKYPRGEHSGYGFEIGEKLTVRDLIYASILRSDGVACLTLADYIAGSEAEFVKLMNNKVQELGLLDGDPENNPSTMFQNCTGLHEKYHYTTCYDMAVIMAYAMKNPFCANVLTTLKYTPSDNFRLGEGCVFWNQFLHEYLNDSATQPSTANITGGKTGWTGNDSGYCLVSFARGKNGHDYILVTGKSDTRSKCIDDTINIYNDYIK